MYKKGGSGGGMAHRQGHAGGKHRRHPTGMASGIISPAIIASEACESLGRILPFDI